MRSTWFHLAYTKLRYQRTVVKVGAPILLLVVRGVIYRLIYPLHRERSYMCMWVGQVGLTLQATMGAEYPMEVMAAEGELAMSVPQLGTCTAG